jgi:hypothetical protein
LLTMLLLRSRMLDTCFCTCACHCAASWRVSKPSVKEVYPRVASQLVGQWMVTQYCTGNHADKHEMQLWCAQAYSHDMAELFSTVGLTGMLHGVACRSHAMGSMLAAARHNAHTQAQFKLLDDMFGMQSDSADACETACVGGPGCSEWEHLQTLTGTMDA